MSQGAVVQFEQKKVLIVEDNELNLKLFQDLLSAHGCSTVEVTDGKDALNVAKIEQPDLILMDIQLPNISGLDLINDFRAEQLLKDTPIIAVTAFAMQQDKDKILSSGCQGYISKPISIENFVTTITPFLS